MVRHGWAVVCLAVLAVNAKAEETTFQVAAGANQEVSVGDLQRVGVMDPAVAEVRVLREGTVLISGVSAGETRMVTTDKNGRNTFYRVEVIASPHAAAAAKRAAPIPSPKELAEAASFASLPKELVVRAGTQRVINFAQLKRVSVGDPEIADIHMLNKSQLLILGGAPGKTTLIAWDQNDKRTEFTIAVEK